MTDTKMFSTGYMDDALFRPDQIVKQAKADLKGKHYDTLVGTGFSGGIIIPMLAAALGKQFLLVRKENDSSHHGAGRLMGSLGKRWLFVDDFVGSGKTKGYVLDKIQNLTTTDFLTYKETKVDTKYVGDYLYVPAMMGDGGFKAVDQAAVDKCLRAYMVTQKPAYSF